MSARPGRYRMPSDPPGVGRLEAMLSDMLAELRALRNEVRAVSANLELVRDAVEGHTDRITRLERARLTPVPQPDDLPASAVDGAG